MSPKDAEQQTVYPLGAVWCGSTLFAQTCLSKNLGSLRYLMKKDHFLQFSVKKFVVGIH